MQSRSVGTCARVLVEPSLSIQAIRDRNVHPSQFGLPRFGDRHSDYPVSCNRSSESEKIDRAGRVKARKDVVQYSQASRLIRQ